MLPLLSECRFGSLLAYTPRPSTPNARWAKDFCLCIKQDGVVVLGHKRVRAIAYAAKRLRDRLDETPFGTLLGDRTVLVPTPGSGMLVAGALWPAKRLCDELVANGLGLCVWAALHRSRAVTKSALVEAKDRPKAQEHYDSLECRGSRPLDLRRAERVVVVDDVITRGATMLAAVSHLVEAVSQAEVAGFALLRTISRPEELRAVLSPTTGTIRLRRGEAYREP